ncbi:hypothetical protein TNCV_3896491 [Trichonephila clavipes]|nr:hypothetical protein TNCV_3896491 [Trichonephila clavipes]
MPKNYLYLYVHSVRENIRKTMYDVTSGSMNKHSIGLINSSNDNEQEQQGLNLAQREPILPQLKRFRQNGKSPNRISKNLVPELLPPMAASNACV